MAGMYKNQLQELAQRSCFNLPSYTCVREGPDHAPRFRASVNFHGEIFHGPRNCTTVRQAEHAAAEVALTALSNTGPSRSLAARVLDETGVYKNLLQETAHRAGLKLPVYTSVRTGPGHQPVFTCCVEIAGLSFTGECGKTKKQAEKNAALTAWSCLRQMPDFGMQIKETEGCGEEKGKSTNQMFQRRDCSAASSRNSVRCNQQSKRKGFAPSSDSSSNYQCAPSAQEPISSKEYSSNRVRIPFPVSKKNESGTEAQIAKAKRDEEGKQIAPITDEPAKDRESFCAVEFTRVPLYARAFPRPNSSEFTAVDRRPFSRPVGPFTGSRAMQVQAMFATGGFSASGIAPAVNIRTVVPVCAARPTGNTTAKRGEGGEVCAASSILKKLQL